MTIFQYLATLKSDPLNPATSPALKYFVDDATPEQVDSADGKPYAIVEELDESVITDLYDHEKVMQQLVDVTLYQQPTTGGDTPDKTAMIGVWHDVMNAVHNVTAHTYKRTFIELSLISALEPMKDRETKGLFGSVRFRILFTRG